MNYCNWRSFLMALLIASAGLGMIAGCDSGEQVIDEVTGNRAVKQYHRTEKNIEKLTKQQAERYKNIPGDEKEDRERQ